MPALATVWRRGKSRANAFITAAVIVLVVILAILGATDRAAAATPRNCIGTYLVVEGSETQSLWTFDQGRTLQITSSAQDVAPNEFSHQQGAWKRIGPRLVEGTTLDFAVDGVYAPTSTARIDALITFSNDCRSLTGSIDLRFYPAPADPLDKEAAAVVLSDTITGRLVTTD